ncbi:signal peptidase I [Parashewanella spongiae]|uniref:Signal peptidase I n=1 Tax=Parashewanella spongiae TaxID=342950 RepID=A0A3A6TRH8_9GAMM|nr:signal peptidase I [Parashewanella spongiae]MCL1079242.1 signal peptidase I [Parashewanella spongiae]RJY11070.1 signal peptidase I [Parashewanella spongiae]
MAAYFSLILVIITLVSGIIWAIDAFAFAPKRKQALALAETKQSLDDDAKEKILREPAVVETAHSIFPVIAFVLVLRSFIYEPFQIPSGSMMPTLLVGDFILVEKFSYGLKDPVWRSQLVETGKPKRGDVVVFKYPVDPKVDYIKRVIGLPGDKIIYRNKHLSIVKACVDKSDCPKAEVVHTDELNRGEFNQDGVAMLRYEEQLGDVNHDILINPSRREMTQAYLRQAGTKSYEFVVPEGQYFMMGDNRDNSLDSRFWGFVPEANLVGKAVAIWISFEFERTEADLLPTWIPTGVRFNRVGGIV